MKTSLLSILLLFGFLFASAAEAASPSDILSANVADEVKAFLPDYQLVHGDAKWNAPHLLKANGQEIICGTALCIFREKAAISASNGLLLAMDVLEGFRQRYEFNGMPPTASTVFARTGVEEGEATSESRLELVSDEGSATGTKTTIIVTARFVSSRAEKFGILLQLTRIK